MFLTHSNPDVVPQEHGLEAVAGCYLERFLRGFQEGCFQDEVDEFIKRSAPQFAVPHLDGSFPLEWTELHNDYKRLFDQQLEAILWFQDSDKDRFLEYCNRLYLQSCALPNDAELPEIVNDHRLSTKPSGGRRITVADFRSFMAAITASEDFERFLAVMFAATTGSLRPTLRLSDSQDQSTSMRVSLEIPVGIEPGQMLEVTCLGVRQEIQVPAGYSQGAALPLSMSLS